MMPFARFLIAGVALCLAPAALASGTATPWTPVTAETGTSDDPAALVDLSYEYPDSAAVRLRLVNALYDTGDEAFAGQVMALAMKGYAMSEAGEATVRERLDPDYALLFSARTVGNRARIEASRSLATLPVEAELVESVARDPETGDLYATTVISRALFMKRGDAPWERVEIDEAGSLSGIAWDAKRKLFWIASGMSPQTPGDPVYSAALGFDPQQGRVVRKLYANGMVPLGDIAVGDDGLIYAANPLAGEIHFADPEKDEGFRALVGQGIFRSPQGMVPVPGSNLLIVSDYGYGLAALDRSSGKVWRITGASVFLDGIDALQRNGRSLIAVQNGHRPMRILKLDMAKDWLSIEKVTVLESAHPAWTEPVGGTVEDAELLYVANGQWASYGEGGRLNEGAVPAPAELRALPLGK